ncbi:MAG: helix-turn-helix domain-containing protein [Parcubacteria group bacterium]
MDTQRKPVTFDDIDKAVVSAFGIPLAQLCSKRRTQEVARARMAAMYLARTLMIGCSLKTIGSHYGGRDHSTVIHAVNTVRERLKIETDLRCRVTHALELISGEPEIRAPHPQPMEPLTFSFGDTEPTVPSAPPA